MRVLRASAIWRSRLTGLQRRPEILLARPEFRIALLLFMRLFIRTATAESCVDQRS